jgi:hypothetical protein
MTISPTLGVIIMMNNYFHDVATALLAASGVALWVIIRRYEDGTDRATAEYFLRVYSGMTRLARFSLYWILIGGVPRTIFYKSFEWANAVDHAQVPALIVKHILAFTFVGTGVYLWRKFNRKVKEVRQTLETGEVSREVGQEVCREA